MSNETVISATSARHKTMQRQRGLDPATYSIPARKRVDAKFVMAGLGNEVLFNNVADSVGRRVRVKNTSGGTYAKGTLVGLAGALTVQTTDTASNNPTAGTNVVITIAGSWQVGMEVAITSGGRTDYAIITAVGSGNITVDFLPYDHTTPVVTAEPAYEISLADADAAAPAEWVLPDAILAGEYGYAYDCWEVTGLDTSAFSAEALLYLSATAGTYTATAPTGSDQIQQVVGVVKSSHATTGAILFIPGNKRILKFGSSFLQTGAALVADGDKGDVIVSSSGTVWTIDNLVVTNAKIANGTIDLTAKVTGVLPVANGGTGISSFGAGVATFLGTPSSANLRSALTDETGTGVAVFNDTPTLIAPLLGTPTSGVLTNCTGLPLSGLVNDVRDEYLSKCNLLIGDMRYWQLGGVSSAVTLVNDTHQSADRWNSLIQGTGPTFQRQSASTGFTSQYVGRLTSGGTTNRGGLSHMLRADETICRRGQALKFSIRVRANKNAGSGSIDVRYAVLEWTGTANAIVSDVVNSWTSSTYTAGNFFKSTTMNVLATGMTSFAHNTAAQATLDVNVGASANNLIAFFWLEDVPAHASDYIDVGEVGLYPGNVAPVTWRDPDAGESLRRCQKHVCKTFNIDVTPADNLNTYSGVLAATASGTVLNTNWNFPVTLWKTLVSPNTADQGILTYNPATGGTAGNWRDGLDTSSATAGTSVRGDAMVAMSGSGATDATNYYIHAVAYAHL